MTFWNKAEKDAVVWLANGRSAAEIAALLTEMFDRPFNPSMVSGQANRLGLSLVTRKQDAQRRKMVEEPKVAATQLPSMEAMKAALQGCTILELTSDKCKWPLWTHERPTLASLYCGEVARGPYCKEHRKRAYSRDPRASMVTVRVPAKPLKSGTL